MCGLSMCVFVKDLAAAVEGGRDREWRAVEWVDNVSEWQ